VRNDEATEYEEEVNKQVTVSYEGKRVKVAVGVEVKQRNK
jgi:hypothetical protein